MSIKGFGSLAQMIIINRLFSGAILVLYTTVLSIFAGPTVPTEAQIKLSHGDRRIGTYVSSEKGFGTSSYWIEGPTGLIFIDTQFLLSAGLEALNWAEQITGKKTQLAIILHPNPDKFNGTLIYKKRGIRVVTSKQVQELIPEVHKDRTHWFYERFKPDYPNELPLPDSFGNSRQSLNAGGVTVTAHVLGMGCSAAHVVVQFENHVFVGDLVSNGNHSWIELGRLEEWLKRLDEISAMNPSFVHPGRGPAGGAELLEREEDYLKSILKIVRQSGLQKKSSEKLMNRLQEQIENKYPGYGYSYFLEIGLPAVWAYETKVSSRSSRVK